MFEGLYSSQPALDIAKIFKGRVAFRDIMLQDSREFEIQGALRGPPLT